MALLRSISLQEDLEYPDRFAQYRPTRKSLPVLRAVLYGKPTIVTAAYGSGKSLAAGVGALTVANDSEALAEIAPVFRRLRKVDSGLADHIDDRRNSGRRGTTIVLSGYVRCLTQALANKHIPPPPANTKNE